MTTVKLEKVRLGLECALEKEWLDVSVVIDADSTVEEIVLRARGLMLAEQYKHIEIKYPDGWKQAFKERWYPSWLLKRYPVKYKECIIDVKALYPGYKATIPDQEAHLHIYHYYRYRYKEKEKGVVDLQ